jgi:hypothetical protein
MFAVCAVLTGLLLGVTADQYDLRHRFTEGDTLTYSLKLVARDTEELPTVLAGYAAGLWEVKLTVESVTPDQTQIRVSRVTRELPAEVLSSIPKDLIPPLKEAKNVVAVVHGDGSVTVEGDSGSLGDIRGWLRYFLVPGLPSRPVSTGHGWQERYQAPDGASVVTQTFKYRFVGPEVTEGLECYRLNVEAGSKDLHASIGAAGGEGSTTITFQPSRRLVYFLARDDGRVLRVMGMDTVNATVRTPEGREKVKWTTVVSVHLDDVEHKK